MEIESFHSTVKIETHGVLVFYTALYQLKRQTSKKFKSALNQIKKLDGETMVVTSAFYANKKSSDEIAYDLYLDIIRLMFDSCEGSNSDRLKQEVLELIGATSQTETFSSQSIADENSSFAHEESKKGKRLDLITSQDSQISDSDQSENQVSEDSSSQSSFYSEFKKKTRKRELKSSFKQQYRIQQKPKMWSEEEKQRFEEALQKYGKDYLKISLHMGTRTREQVQTHYNCLNYSVELSQDSGLYKITSRKQKNDYFWSDEEKTKLEQILLDYGKDYNRLQDSFPNRSYKSIQWFFRKLAKQLKQNPSTKGQQILQILQQRAKYRKLTPKNAQKSQDSVPLSTIYEESQDELSSVAVNYIQFLETALDRHNTHENSSEFP